MASTFRRPPLLPQTATETGAPPKPAGGVPTREYAEKLNLARRLHEQGVNPLAWTKAQPAAFADQDDFRKTGRKPRENQFEVGGRLYDWSPEIAATPAQGRAALDAYLKEIGDPRTSEAPPLESYVDIDKVLLRHPFGQPAFPSNAEGRDAHLRNMIKIGVNPASAHLGDPVPMLMQDKLRGIFEHKLMSETPPSTPVASSEPEATDLLYRHADGWIYTKNEATRETPAVAGIRMRHGEKRAALPAPAANDNDTDEEEEIFQHYRAADAEQAYNERAAKELSLIAVDMPHIVSLVEKAQAGQTLDDREQQTLTSLQEKFTEIGLELDPARADIAYLRTVATAIDKAKASVDKAMTAGISAETQLGRAPLHVAAQALNNEIAQALAGSTIAWAQVSQKGAGEALKRGLQSMRGKLRPLGLLAQSTIGGLNAAQIAKQWAEEDGNPDIMSPYPEKDTAINLNQTTSNIHRPLPTLPSGLTNADVRAIEDISARNGSAFTRASSNPIGAPEAANILREGAIVEIEVFGFPLAKADPRGNEQTQSRAEKIKQMAIEKLTKCGAVIQQKWGGNDEDNPGDRVKERHVPPGLKGTLGARKSDLAFKILWNGKIYILDINTVDILVNGLPTSREARALKSLSANRIARIHLKNSHPDFKDLEEYEGKVGAFKKGKGMSDEEWEKEAREWVDEFVDCNEPLDVTLSDDVDSRE